MTRWQMPAPYSPFPGAPGKGERRPWASALGIVLLAIVFLSPSALAAGPPLITGTSFSAVTETAATLEGQLDPNGAAREYHFDYIDQASFEADGESFGEGTEQTPSGEIPALVKGKGALTASSPVVKGLTIAQGAFAPGQAISGPGVKPSTTIVSVGTEAKTGLLELQLSQAALETRESTLTATGPQPVSARIEALTPGTPYHLRLVATSSVETIGPEATLYTLAAPPNFGPCLNDAFRLGQFAPFGQPSAALPDCRAYEQATPVDKNGGDVVGTVPLTMAAETGAAVSFGSAFTIPGALGAQDRSLSLATRGEAETGWSTFGLLPPARAAQKASIKGWLPDFSAIFTEAVKLGRPRMKALLELHRNGSPPTEIAPYTAHTGGTQLYAYAGSSKNGQVIVFEATAKLPPAAGEEPIAAAKDGTANVYVWDRQSGRIRLASALNSETESEAALSRGAFAGPYEWVHADTSSGGAAAGFFTKEQRAVSSDGSVFFTAKGTGQLYQRLNPTHPQSVLDSEGNCIQPDKACTFQLSASQRTPSDPGGAAPAAFQAASADGKLAYFTSSEELTDNANTGPVQPPAQIGRAKLNGSGAASDLKEDFLPANALGLATSPDGEYVYWANPHTNDIGRAKLNGEGSPAQVEPNYIDTGDTKAITQPEAEPGKYHFAHSTPRHVAVDGEFVYWTNTGPLGSNLVGPQDDLQPIIGGGSIGRAKIGPTEAEGIEPEFITGATNPRGVAVNPTHIYWANADENSPVSKGIGRAEINGHNIDQEFIPLVTETPNSIVLSASHIYFATSELGPAPGNSYLVSTTLDGSERNTSYIGDFGVRGIAFDGNELYWATQGEGGAIGRILANELPNGNCAAIVSCEKGFIKPVGTLEGVVSDGSRLYWSVNGEIPPNPGNDLYRYDSGNPSEPLTDLTPDSVDVDGARVQGVLGTSDDGSYVYLVANADFDGEAGGASPGNCETDNSIYAVTGACSLYLLHEGTFTFIARLQPGNTEALDWGPILIPAEHPKTALVSPDGRTLLFLSRQKLTSYDNHGIAELYRFRVGEPPLTCVSCNPSGVVPSAPPTLGTIHFNGPGQPLPTAAALNSRYLVSDGDRAFFESREALVSGDTNDAQDVYEWEAIGACSPGSPGYSAQNHGCLYLISTGKSPEDSVFVDASASGNDVFFVTRQSLVGQDTDLLTDIYDARVGGGLAAENPLPQVECEADACKGAAAPPPPFEAPPQFAGPPNPKPKRTKSCHGKKGKCAKHKHKRKHQKKHSRRINSAHRFGGSK